jgi:predicted anti-sigma-YlaC factor YlaD
VTITCKQALESLVDYLEGSMTPEVKREIEQHLADCGCCPGVIESYMKTAKLCHKALKKSAPAGLVQRLMDSLREKTRR